MGHKKTTMKNTILIVALVIAAINGACTSSEERSEKTAAAFRELNSRIELQNDEQQLANDRIKADTAESGGCVSGPEEIPYSAAVESTKHQTARQNKEKAQQRCNKILATKALHTRCLSLAATTDQSDDDQSSRLACVRDENNAMSAGDARLAELNAAVRRLNAVTKSEMN
jgi:hypothetical protein